MFRLTLSCLAALVALVTVDVQDVQTADACGVKQHIRKVRHARATSGVRRATGNAGERTPLRVGPEQVARNEAPIRAGGDASGRAGTDTQAEPAKSVDNGTPAPEPPKKKKTRPVKKPEPVVAEATPEPEPTPEPATEPAPTEPAPATSDAPSGDFHREYSFDNGSSVLGDEEQSNLRTTAAWIQAHPKKRIIVEGHANKVGSASINMTISAARAQSVIDFLVSEGVDAKRLKKRAMGMKKPAYEPGSDGRNRRVVLIAK